MANTVRPRNGQATAGAAVTAVGLSIVLGA